jgi:hypothetical protein
MRPPLPGAVQVEHPLEPPSRGRTTWTAPHGSGSDSVTLLGVGMLMGGALGAVVGSLLGDAGAGGAAGAGMVGWTMVVI